MPVCRQIQDIRESIRQRVNTGDRLYAVLEGTGDKRALHERVSASELSLFFLYYDTDFEKLMHISPMLLSIPPKSSFLDWMLEEGMTAHAGILACGSCEPTRVRRHFQDLLEVILPDLNLALFRFYDPVVLHRYAYVVDDQARLRLLGPLSACFWPRCSPGGETRWHSLASDLSASAKDDDAPPPPVRVTEAQMNSFEQAYEKEFAARLLSHFAS
ncbi:MAG: DUF4123 domain-containing protein [Desulfovibrionaceae bacterium]|nr:DUF4123 domain-containing protein [Desulfovibrionaceae bacterium]